MVRPANHRRVRPRRVGRDRSPPGFMTRTQFWNSMVTLLVLGLFGAFLLLWAFG